ncbi:hypothetical protein CPC08DRAFT_705230 [Agrocybe pediades]|nr:hypothetical protein CPC08DRAFT_705230 [Agrocybe pediades]
MDPTLSRERDASRARCKLVDGPYASKLHLSSPLYGCNLARRRTWMVRNTRAREYDDRKCELESSKLYPGPLFFILAIRFAHQPTPHPTNGSIHPR